MLDIKFIRENLELVKAGAKKKRVEVDLDALMTLDEKRRELTGQLETKKAEQNKVSQEVARADETRRTELIAGMKTLKEDIQELEDELKEVLANWRLLMLRVPNIPDMSVPEGESGEDNTELKTWGKKPHFSFEPKSHIELMTALGMADFERGAKAHGFRGYFLQNDGALLSWAVWNYARDFFLKKNFTPIIVPAILNKEHFFGTGHLPGDAQDIFQTQDDQYLAGTAEVPMMAYHAGEILAREEVPKR